MRTEKHHWGVTNRFTYTVFLNYPSAEHFSTSLLYLCESFLPPAGGTLHSKKLKLTFFVTDPTPSDIYHKPAEPFTAQVPDVFLITVM